MARLGILVALSLFRGIISNACTNLQFPTRNAIHLGLALS